jgi:hypothetical protein
MNFGYEEQPLGDDEMTDIDGPDREKAPSVVRTLYFWA